MPLIDWAPFLEVETSMLRPEAYQREANEVRVKAMVKDFRPNLFGALTTAEGEGFYAVIDGQHRWRVAQEKQLETVWVQLHAGLDYPARARMFVDLQQRRKNLVPLDRFKGELEADDPQAVAIQSMVRKAGLLVTGSRIDAQRGVAVKAVTACERIYRKDPEALERTLAVITRWPPIAKERLNGQVIEGIGRFLAKNPKVDPGELFERFERADLRASELRVRSVEMAEELKKLPGRHTLLGTLERVVGEVWDDPATAQQPVKEVVGVG